ncbi:TraX family protein [Pseudomonas syringae]|uniref:TraX family protein n=1 Tax=Pseudomonas syringae TaxID=317 RepID=UPI0002098DDE|nr:TraX family protein [Pseudomonas syringae]MDP5168595.1 TraX family protein [Pseudomonas syringae pv. aptata str. DSM 50252]
MNRIAIDAYFWPRLVVSDGTIEAIKWLALVLMIGDHVNKYLLNDTVAWLYDAGRVAMPLFMFVLAYNLARPGAVERGAYRRTMIRLAISGTLATPAFIALGGLVNGWWPLNIMATLLVLTATLRLLEIGTLPGYLAATVVFVLGGSTVEFWWPAICLGVAIWSYTKQPSPPALILSLVACAALAFINGNHWALASLPIMLAAPFVHLRVKRVRWFFYGFYPAHLALIWLIRIPLRQAGYLFFT